MTQEQPFRLRFRKSISRPGAGAVMGKSIASRIVHAVSEYEARMKLVQALQREAGSHPVNVFFVE